jgi:hypothetical protein
MRRVHKKKTTPKRKKKTLKKTKKRCKHHELAHGMCLFAPCTYQAKAHSVDQTDAINAKLAEELEKVKTEKTLRIGAFS